MTLFNRYFFWPLLLIGHFLTTSLLAWHLLAQFNFAYPLGYSLLNIEQHIQEYGPQNRYKSDFAQTTASEHRALFGEISRAVQNHGQGLADIDYRLPDGNKALLMREPEVIHLQDVANLIDVFYITGYFGAGIWLLMLAAAYRQRYDFPKVKKILLGYLIGVASLTLVTLVIGPKAVFYWLHVKIFPDEHEWFFFYQDSLMTTLMKAPDLFGFIGVLLVGLWAVIWTGSLLAMAHLLPPHATPGDNLPSKPQGKSRSKSRGKSQSKARAGKGQKPRPQAGQSS